MATLREHADAPLTSAQASRVGRQARATETAARALDEAGGYLLRSRGISSLLFPKGWVREAPKIPFDFQRGFFARTFR